MRNVPGKPALLLAAACLLLEVTVVLAADLPEALLASQAAEPAVWVLDARGRVDVLRERLRSPARPRQRLVPMDRVQTWTNSHANLLWYGQTHFQVSELSDISIPSPPGANRRGVVELLKGFLYFFHRGPPRELEIKTPTAAAIVVGTEFSVNVEPGGRTVLLLFDGTLEVTNPQGQARVEGGQKATINPGQAPVVSPILEGINDLIQWFLYYPGVLHVDEAKFTPAEEPALAESLAAYRAGDLREALRLYPTGRAPASNADRLYTAALLLSVGQVDRAEPMLAVASSQGGTVAELGNALQEMIRTVKGRPGPPLSGSQSATVHLAESYRRQARGELAESLAAARRAVELAPRFGFGWARVAELEFSFGRTAKSLDAVERALALAPSNAEALALKGFLLSAQSRGSEALDYFDRAVSLDGGLGHAWLGRGLCRLRTGQIAEGHQDLLIAAAVEPQRSLLRSYLGKALADAGADDLAAHELQLARQLDPRDPTALHYSALLQGQRLRFNDAVRDLEAAGSLDQNRAVFRSRLLLDQDRAVRGANLAALYRQAGLEEVSVREATRAVNYDYANYSAHLFLAGAYQQLRDPRQVNLRYETATLSEYLVANLLAPVGAGTLSPTVSQQEYSRLFERDRLGIVSSTEYRSNGDWLQSLAQYGVADNLGYVFDAGYRRENGQRPNQDHEQLQLSLQLKHQVTPRDTILFQPRYYDARGGDLTPYYDPAQANRAFRFHETQEPELVAGYRREWSPAHQTLLLAGRLQDTLQFDYPMQEMIVLNRQGGVTVGLTTTTNDQRNEIVDYFAEGQHIWKAGPNTAVFGLRYHQGAFSTRTAYVDSEPFNLGVLPLASIVVTGETTRVNTELERAGAYIYDYLNVGEHLRLTGGAVYDWVRFPVNWRSLPISSDERETHQWSPKAGVTWLPVPDTALRANHTRSLGGATIDQSYRLEPTQVAGFNQSYRSLVPESIAGNVPVPSFETWGVALERQWKSGLSLGLDGEWLRSEARQDIGVTELTYAIAFPSPTYSLAPSSTSRNLDFEERTLSFTVNQLIGSEWSFGGRYRVSDAQLRIRYPELPANPILPPETDQSAVLHHVQLFGIYNHSSGWFGQARARWYAQQNFDDAAGLGDEGLWQFDLHAGLRLPRGRGELRLGLLNLTDQDYRLNPLNLLSELPRSRTLTISLQFNF